MSDADAERLLFEAVATPSVSRDEARVAELLVGAMALSADEALVDAAGNAVGRWGEGPVSVTFLGHLDTVRGWIEPRVEDGWLHGRGAVDAKGPLCAALAAVSRLGDDGLAGMTVRVIGAVEEEVASSRGARYAADAYPGPDALIVCEPSGWQRYTLGYKGTLRLRLGCALPEGHGARRGDGPTELVVDAWKAVQAWAVERRANGAATQAGAMGLAGDPGPADARGPAGNPGPAGARGPASEGVFDAVQARLHGVNSRSDGLLARCSARATLRLPPGLGWRAAAAELAALELPAGVELVVGSGVDACTAAPDTHLAACFRSSIRAAGGAPVATRKTGTSDWNVVAERWDPPAPVGPSSAQRLQALAYGPGDPGLEHPGAQRPQALAYGPGDPSLDHTPDERLELAEYRRSIRVIEGALREFTLRSAASA